MNMDEGNVSATTKKDSDRPPLIFISVLPSLRRRRGDGNSILDFQKERNSQNHACDGGTFISLSDLTFLTLLLGASLLVFGETPSRNDILMISKGEQVVGLLGFSVLVRLRGMCENGATRTTWGRFFLARVRPGPCFDSLGPDRRTDLCKRPDLRVNAVPLLA